ncbi:hypothetical protein [Alkalihalobacterium alkalinitrilicum]|uniref:hypothetical protein n=1 Tax=Alkalihalobacterium alkalinitrilicum TaxID=427920 RepID=UPI000995A203|nr:hypothetical protein [Alkalihalobacterium alkalinitrilicum]
MDILYVYKPKIDNDTVKFSWNFSFDNNVFRKNEFYIKYDGFNITDIDFSVFYEVFLGLMTPVLKETKREYLILLPESISNTSVNFWLSYNEAENIKVFPVEDKQPEKTYSNFEGKDEIGILFGGGKDSLFTYNLYKEIFGTENISVISFVFPMDHSNLKKLDQRREKFALNHIANDGVTVRKIYTDFRSIFKIYSYFNHLHTQLYYLMSFPLYLKTDMSYLTYSYEFTHYWNKDHNGKEYFHFKKSRPEFDDLVSNYLHQRLGKPFKVFNSNYYISETLAFKIINDRYKRVEDVMMCEAVVDPEEKWCGQCYKCGEFVIYSLANKYENKELDIDAFLNNSKFINKIINQVEENNYATNKEGNIIWFEGLVSHIHYMSLCHIVNSIDVDFWSTKLSEKAILNLSKIKSWFGNKNYEILDSFILEALKKLNLPFEDKIIKIMDEHAHIVKSNEVEFLFGNHMVVADYNLSYPIQLHEQNVINKDDISTSIIDSTAKDLFNRHYKKEIVSYNTDTNETVPYIEGASYNGYFFHMDKLAPKKGDTLELKYHLESLNVDKSYHIKLSLVSLYKSQYKDRMKYSLLLDHHVLLDEDIASWQHENSINVYFKAKSNKHLLTIKVTAVNNCEPWNWGKVACITLQDLQLKQVPLTETQHISCSSPYSNIYEFH